MSERLLLKIKVRSEISTEVKTLGCTNRCNPLRLSYLILFFGLCVIPNIACTLRQGESTLDTSKSETDGPGLFRASTDPFYVLWGDRITKPAFYVLHDIRKNDEGRTRSTLVNLGRDNKKEFLTANLIPVEEKEFRGENGEPSVAGKPFIQVELESIGSCVLESANPTIDILPKIKVNVRSTPDEVKALSPTVPAEDSSPFIIATDCWTQPSDRNPGSIRRESKLHQLIRHVGLPGIESRLAFLRFRGEDDKWITRQVQIQEYAPQVAKRQGLNILQHQAGLEKTTVNMDFDSLQDSLLGHNLLTTAIFIGAIDVRTDPTGGGPGSFSHTNERPTTLTNTFFVHSQTGQNCGLANSPSQNSGELPTEPSPGHQGYFIHFDLDLGYLVSPESPVLQPAVEANAELDLSGVPPYRVVDGPLLSWLNLDNSPLVPRELGTAISMVLQRIAAPEFRDFMESADRIELQALDYKERSLKDDKEATQKTDRQLMTFSLLYGLNKLCSGSVSGESPIIQHPALKPWAKTLEKKCSAALSNVRNMARALVSEPAFSLQ